MHKSQQICQQQAVTAELQFMLIYSASVRHIFRIKLLGRFPIEIKTEIGYLIICCYLDFIR